MTAFQSTINRTLGFGVVGEFLFDGPERAERLTINSAGTPNVIGYAFTKNNATGIASVGGAITPGTSVFAGILANPKAYVSYGTAGGGPLAPTLILPDQAEGTFVTMGLLCAYVNTAANIGDQIIYATATGALSAVAPGAAAGTGNALVPNCFVDRYPTSAAGLVCIRLTTI